MKYNDNGEYKDIYVKSFDTLPIGAEVDYDGETVPTGWTEVQDETGTIEITNTSQVSGTINYAKVGRLIEIYYDLKITSGTSTTWSSMTITTVPDKLKPLLYTVSTVSRDVDKGSNYNIISCFIQPNGTLGFSDRGRGNLSTSVNAYVGHITYISAE